VESGTESDVGLLCAKAEETPSPEGVPPADWSPLGKYARYKWVQVEGITTPEQLCHHYRFDYDATLDIGRRALANERLCGLATIYDWKRKYWEPSWARSCCGAVKSESLAEALMVTRWGPPVPLMKVLAHLFPYCDFRVHFSIEQGCGDGTATITATAANANYDVHIENNREGQARGTLLLDGIRRSFRRHQRRMPSTVHSEILTIDCPEWTKRPDYLNIKSAICCALGTVVYSGYLHNSFAEMMEDAEGSGEENV